MMGFVYEVSSLCSLALLLSTPSPLSGKPYLVSRERSKLISSLLVIDVVILGLWLLIHYIDVIPDAVFITESSWFGWLVVVCNIFIWYEYVTIWLNRKDVLIFPQKYVTVNSFFVLPMLVYLTMEWFCGVFIGVFIWVAAILSTHTTLYILILSHHNRCARNQYLTPLPCDDDLIDSIEQP